MKKLFVLMIMLLGIVTMYSQNTITSMTSQPTPAVIGGPEHLTFSGITICGSADTFRQAMENKGFVSNKSEDSENIMVFNGNFIGKSTDQIFVILTPKTKQVWKVVVYFLEKSSWYDLKNEYNNLKDQVVQKYGTPKDDFHFFSGPYKEGDGYEMTGVKVDKCNYAAFWDNGIILEISKYGSVKLTYEDPIQVKIVTEEKNQMAQDGL